MKLTRRGFLGTAFAGAVALPLAQLPTLPAQEEPAVTTERYEDLVARARVLYSMNNISVETYMRDYAAFGEKEYRSEWGAEMAL